ncbi:MAG: tripartite tricarboxylate transporter substrate binding protein [Burkholderiales bacterium]|nr:tripartite tricarboxylate transporter substrate binding protein [Burkholderiales bacterium]
MRLLQSATSVALWLSLSAAFAQYPTKPVRLIVPLAPGGGVDALARVIGTSLSDSFKQSVIVDNRPGATGSIGAVLTARSAPDGYTLLMASASFLLYPLMQQSPYDPLRDFAPITQAVSLPLLLVMHAGVPASNVRELISFAKARPGMVKFGSSGSGGFPHLAAELLKSTAGMDIIHVPYKGNASAVPDLLAGQIQFMFAGLGLTMPHMKSGKLRGLAVSGRTRLKAIPELPPLSEAGVPGYEATQSYGVLAPKGTPKPIIDRLRRDIAVALQRPETTNLMAMDGAEPVASEPAEYARHIESEMTKWRKVIRESSVTSG